MCIHQGGTGLPEDRLVNTFHFQEEGPDYASLSAASAGALANFFSGVGIAPNAQSASIESYLSPWVSGLWEIRTYNMELPGTKLNPRVPTIYPQTQLSFGSGTGVVEEVAVVGTFYGAKPVTRRRRGRVYIGPLNNGAVAAATGPTAPSRPTANFISDLVKAMHTMANSKALILLPCQADLGLLLTG
jgi:hypothetical protein